MPSVPKELAQLVDAMIARDPAQRPDLATVRALLRKFRMSDSAPLEAIRVSPVPADPPRPVTPQDLRETRRGFRCRSEESRPTRQMIAAAGTPPRAMTAYALTVSNGRWGHDDIAMTFTANVEPTVDDRIPNRLHISVAPTCRVATASFFRRVFDAVARHAPSFEMKRS